MEERSEGRQGRPVKNKVRLCWIYGVGGTTPAESSLAKLSVSSCQPRPVCLDGDNGNYIIICLQVWSVSTTIYELGASYVIHAPLKSVCESQAFLLFLLPSCLPRSCLLFKKVACSFALSLSPSLLQQTSCANAVAQVCPLSGVPW